MNSNEMIDVDLPSLQSIELGYYALKGLKGDSDILVMRSINEMLCNN